MKSKLFIFMLVGMLALAACGPAKTDAPGTNDSINAFPVVIDNAEDSYPAKEPETDPEVTYPVSDIPEIKVLAPSSTTSIPILLAAKYLPGMTVEIFDNHPQAHAQFISEPDTVLVTGLSVGINMFNNEVPIEIINTNVTGLAYLVSCNLEINSFADLKGHEIYLPFEGSPMEETTQFFVEKAGLKYGEDVKPIYAPFDTSTALIQQGQDAIVAMPQPAATAMAAQECGHLGASFYETWNEVTGDTDGYPQVAAFAKATFTKENSAWVKAFNVAVSKAIADLQADPDAAVAEVAEHFKQPAPVLTKALLATKFTVKSGQEMKDSVFHYYETIGKPLDEKFEGFFYTLP
jgi:ABC-type nitrate/sulfonate/bicarbonate transport system substrate-binding protein